MMIFLFLSSLIGYIIGSIPFGYLFVKFFHKKDIRSFGSKNIGATNVWRNGYKLLAIMTFIFDAGKSVLSALLIILILKFSNLNFNIQEDEDFLIKYAPFIAAFFAVIGHLFSLFLKFKGGKGVSTFFGYLFFANHIVFIYSMLIWMLAFSFKRISSIASLSVMLFVLFYGLFFEEDVLKKIMFISSSILIIIAHRKNIKDLLLDKNKSLNTK